MHILQVALVLLLLGTSYIAQSAALPNVVDDRHDPLHINTATGLAPYCGENCPRGACDEVTIHSTDLAYAFPAPLASPENGGTSTSMNLPCCGPGCVDGGSRNPGSRKENFRISSRSVLDSRIVIVGCCRQGCHGCDMHPGPEYNSTIKRTEPAAVAIRKRTSPGSLEVVAPVLLKSSSMVPSARNITLASVQPSVTKIPDILRVGCGRGAGNCDENYSDLDRRTADVEAVLTTRVEEASAGQDSSTLTPRSSKSGPPTLTSDGESLISTQAEAEEVAVDKTKPRCCGVGCQNCDMWDPHNITSKLKSIPAMTKIITIIKKVEEIPTTTMEASSTPNTETTSMEPENSLTNACCRTCQNCDAFTGTELLKRHIATAVGTAKAEHTSVANSGNTARTSSSRFATDSPAAESSKPPSRHEDADETSEAIIEARSCGQSGKNCDMWHPANATRKREPLEVVEDLAVADSIAKSKTISANHSFETATLRSSSPYVPELRHRSSDATSSELEAETSAIKAINARCCGRYCAIRNCNMMIAKITPTLKPGANSTIAARAGKQSAGPFIETEASEEIKVVKGRSCGRGARNCDPGLPTDDGVESWPLPTPAAASMTEYIPEKRSVDVRAMVTSSASQPVSSDGSASSDQLLEGVGSEEDDIIKGRFCGRSHRNCDDKSRKASTESSLPTTTLTTTTENLPVKRTVQVLITSPSRQDLPEHPISTQNIDDPNTRVEYRTINGIRSRCCGVRCNCDPNMITSMSSSGLPIATVGPSSEKISENDTFEITSTSCPSSSPTGPASKDQTPSSVSTSDHFRNGIATLEIYVQESSHRKPPVPSESQPTTPVASKTSTSDGATQTSRKPEPTYTLDKEISAAIRGENKDIVPIIINSGPTHPSRPNQPITLLATIDLKLQNNYISRRYLSAIGLLDSIISYPPDLPPSTAILSNYLDKTAIDATIVLDITAGSPEQGTQRRYTNVHFSVFGDAEDNLLDRIPDLLLGTRLLTETNALSADSGFRAKAVVGVRVLHLVYE